MTWRLFDQPFQNEDYWAYRYESSLQFIVQFVLSRLHILLHPLHIALADITNCDVCSIHPCIIQPFAHVLTCNYRKTSSINRIKSQNLNVSCILLQLSSLNPLKPGVKLRMKMKLEQLQLHLSYQQFYCLLRCDLYLRFYGRTLF